jgi:hypothetical protein
MNDTNECANAHTIALVAHIRPRALRMLLRSCCSSLVCAYLHRRIYLTLIEPPQPYEAEIGEYKTEGCTLDRYDQLEVEVRIV